MFYKIINLIKIHLKLKNKIITSKLKKKDFVILKILMKMNIVKSIKQIKNEKYLIRINSNSYFSNIVNMYKPSKPCSISLKNIIKINRKRNNIFYISTNKGVINNIDAERKKIGGFLVMSVFV